MPPSDRHMPRWAPLAGYSAGVLTLLFFMYIALFQPGPATFAHIIVISLGSGLALGFLGGDAAAKGHLPIEALNQYAATFAITGGAAVVIIFMIIGSYLFIQEQPLGNTEYVSYGLPEDLPLSKVLDMLENDRNVTITVASNCGNLREQVLPKGEHTGENIKSFLELLQFRLRSPSVNYTVLVVQEQRYEISCS